MRRIVLPILSLLAVACSKDFDEITFENDGSKIRLEAETEASQKGQNFTENRTFSIEEHSVAGTTIGFLKTFDESEPPLTYTLESDMNIDIDSATGELLVGTDLNLDFESSATLPFSVSAFNGTTMTEKKYTLKVKDIDETAILTSEERDFIDYFQYLSLWKGPGHSSKDTNRKWGTEMKLYLQGTISKEFRASVEQVIARYGSLLTGGDFKISLTENPEHANAHLFFGSQKEVEEVWPDIYDIIKGGSYDGYTKTPSQNNVISSTRIWLSNPMEALFNHELGHALGLGHSNKCEEENSFLCSMIGADNDISPIEEQVIHYMYHTDLPAGLSENEIEKTLANLLLNDR